MRRVSATRTKALQMIDEGEGARVLPHTFVRTAGGAVQPALDLRQRYSRARSERVYVLTRRAQASLGEFRPLRLAPPREFEKLFVVRGGSRAVARSRGCACRAV
jgi:hypothetical protein